MAFRLKSEAQKAAEAAMTPREKDVMGEADQFRRIAHRIHSDDLLRTRMSQEHRVETLGEHVSASFGGRVVDHDGNKRDAFVASLPFLDNGGAITHDNVGEAVRGVYWASRGDGEQFRDGGYDPAIGLPDMRKGSQISMLGTMKVLPGRDGASERMFVMTEVRSGVHSAEALRTREPDHIAELAARYMKAPTSEEKDAVAMRYGELAVTRREALAGGRGIMSQAETAVVSSGVREMRSKGPSTGIDAVEAMDRSDRGR